MSLSQGWDAGFKSVLIFIGVVFVWLGGIEPSVGNRSVSELPMVISAAALAIGFFLAARRRCVREKAESDANWQSAAGDFEE